MILVSSGSFINVEGAENQIYLIKDGERTNEPVYYIESGSIGLGVTFGINCSEYDIVVHSRALMKPFNHSWNYFTKAGEIEGQRVPGYKSEPDVSSDSTTETFISLKLEIANWRWKGVPFYLRTGKRLPRKLTQIIVNFHCAPVSLFESLNSTCPIEPNAIIITLQPNEGFDLQFQVKTIGQPITLSTQRLHFRYAETFGELPDAYETLLQSVILGDQTLFVRYDEVETAWQIYDQLITIKKTRHPYPAGSWGPIEARRYYSPTYSKTINNSETS